MKQYSSRISLELAVSDASDTQIKKNTQYDKNRERNDTCTVTRNTGRCGYGTYDES